MVKTVAEKIPKEKKTDREALLRPRSLIAEDPLSMCSQIAASCFKNKKSAPKRIPFVSVVSSAQPETSHPFPIDAIMDTQFPLATSRKDIIGNLCHEDNNQEHAKAVLSVFFLSVKNNRLSLAVPSKGLLVLLSKDTPRKKLTVFTKVVSEQEANPGLSIFGYLGSLCLTPDMIERFCNGAVLNEKGELTIPLRVFVNKFQSKKRKAPNLNICSTPVKCHDIIDGVASLLQFSSFFDDSSSNKILDKVFYHMLDPLKDDNVGRWLVTRSFAHPNTHEELFDQVEIVYRAFVSFVAKNTAPTTAGQELSFNDDSLINFYNQATAIFRLLDEKPRNGTLANNIHVFLAAVKKQSAIALKSISAYTAVDRRISVIGNRAEQGFLTKACSAIRPPKLNSGKTLCLPYCYIGDFCKTIETCAHEHIHFHHMSPSDRTEIKKWVQEHKGQIQTST